MNTAASLADAIGRHDRRALAQAITLVESGLKEHQSQARDCLPHCLLPLSQRFESALRGRLEQGNQLSLKLWADT